MYDGSRGWRWVAETLYRCPGVWHFCRQLSVWPFSGIQLHYTKNSNALQKNSKSEVFGKQGEGVAAEGCSPPTQMALENQTSNRNDGHKQLLVMLHRKSSNKISWNLLKKPCLELGPFGDVWKLFSTPCLLYTCTWKYNICLRKSLITFYRTDVSKT